MKVFLGFLNISEIRKVLNLFILVYHCSCFHVSLKSLSRCSFESSQVSVLTFSEIIGWFIMKATLWFYRSNWYICALLRWNYIFVSICTNYVAEIIQNSAIKKFSNFFVYQRKYSNSLFDIIKPLTWNNQLGINKNVNNRKRAIKIISWKIFFSAVPLINFFLNFPSHSQNVKDTRIVIKRSYIDWNYFSPNH